MKTRHVVTVIGIGMLLAYASVARSESDENGRKVEFLHNGLSLGYEAVPWGGVKSYPMEDPGTGGGIQYSSQFSLRYQYKIIEYFGIDVALGVFNIDILHNSDSYNYGTLLDLSVMATGVLPLFNDALELSLSVGPSFGVFFRQMNFTRTERSYGITDKIGYITPCYPLGPNVGMLKIQYNIHMNIFIYLDGGFNYRGVITSQGDGTIIMYSTVGTGAGVRF